MKGNNDENNDWESEREEFDDRKEKNVDRIRKSFVKDSILDETVKESNSQSHSNKPELSDASFRMINFELRKNDSTI